MRCPRCNILEVAAKELCINCKVAITVLDKPSKITDDEIISTSIFLKLMEGCRQCNNNNFTYSAGILEEGELKWFILQVDCDKCNSSYDEILDVRVINEFAQSQ